MMTNSIPASQLRQAVDQVLYYLTSPEPADAAKVTQLIEEHSLVPDASAVDPNRVYHVLRNGSRTRYRKATPGGFRWRVEADAPPPLQPADDPLLGQVKALIADDLENLVGGLLHVCGFKSIRYTNRLSRQPDGGIDLRAMYGVPLCGRVEFLIAVTGTTLDRNRLADFRGRCRQNEQAIIFAHQISPRVRELGQDPAFGVLVKCLDAAEIVEEMEQRSLTVAQLLATGEQMRKAQHD